MFERGVISDAHKKRVPVVLTTTDGTTVRGAVSGTHGDLGEILGDSHPFIEVVNATGIGIYIAKQSIRHIHLDQIPAADQLRKTLGSLPSDNPYLVLGVEPESDEEHCAEAYRKLTKAYHPDRLAGLDLPVEIVEYAASMQARINDAYNQIKGSSVSTPELDSQQVFERRPHWVKEEAA